ncbi:MAG: cell envelope integrity protein TolA [Burkholderiales bacterium]
MMTSALPYSVPKEPGRWRAIALAIFVHAALIAFLWVGIRWQNDTPETIEAEVWSPQALVAAPPPVPVKPVVATPLPMAKEEPVEKPDIALEQEKKKRLKQEMKELKIREAAENKAREKAEKEKKLAEVKKKKQDALDAKKEAQQHEDERKRIAAEANGIGASGTAAGTAAKSQGSKIDATWSQRVSAKVKSNIIFAASGDLETNSPAEFEVGLLPDGSVAGVRKTRSSGIPGFDEAVRRAIDKSQPYPADSSGTVPPRFVSINRPKDQ